MKTTNQNLKKQKELKQLQADITLLKGQVAGLDSHKKDLERQLKAVELELHNVTVRYTEAVVTLRKEAEALEELVNKELEQ